MSGFKVSSFTAECTAGYLIVLVLIKSNNNKNNNNNDNNIIQIFFLYNQRDLKQVRLLAF